MWLCCACVAAQEGDIRRPLAYRAYMERVQRQNPGYAAEQLGVSVAEAELKAAHVFNDFTFGVEYADNDERHKQMGRSVSAELSRTFSPGKRSARIDLARSEKELNGALLEDYFHTLRAEATLAYLHALARQELCRIRQRAFDHMHQLAGADSIRFHLGEIAQIDATRSSLEAGIMYNELIRAQSELHDACLALALWTGDGDSRAVHVPQGQLRVDGRAFDLDELLETAVANRADLAAAMRSVDVAAKALTVARRERNVDFDVALGYSHNTRVRNEIAPAPQFNGVTLGVAIPLKLSNLNRGAVSAAGYRLRQAEINRRRAEQEVRNGVMQRYARYGAALAQVRNYDRGLLQQAEAVIEGKRYSYRRGETSLLEVLDAQRTYDDLQAGYVETVYDCIVSLVELERSAAIWDLRIGE
jgi:cobalt-zinc-cadmium efflux system outer membrane protein